MKKKSPVPDFTNVPDYGMVFFALIKCFAEGVVNVSYRIRPNYRTVRLEFSKLLNKLVVKYQPNKGTL